MAKKKEKPLKVTITPGWTRADFEFVMKNFKEEVRDIIEHSQMRNSTPTLAK